MYEIQGPAYSDNGLSMLEKDVVTNILCWAKTHTFPSPFGLGNFYFLHFCPFQKFATLPCQQSVQKASLGSALHNKLSWPGGYQDFLGSSNKANCRNSITFALQKHITWAFWWYHHSTYSCLTSAPHYTSRQEKIPPGEKTPKTESWTKEPRAIELNKKFASVLAFACFLHVLVARHDSLQSQANCAAAQLLQAAVSSQAGDTSQILPSLVLQRC